MNWRKKLKDFISLFLVAFLFLGILVSILGAIYCYKVLVLDAYNWNLLTLMPVVLVGILILVGFDII